MKHKAKIDKTIKSLPFPTPKNVIWIFKQQNIKLSPSEQLYVWESVQFALEAKLLTLTNPAQIGSIQKYLANNFVDWDPTSNNKPESEKINITISTNNTGKNHI